MSPAWRLQKGNPGHGACRASWSQPTARQAQTAPLMLPPDWQISTRSNLVILTIGGNISGAELRRLADIEGDLSKTLESDANQVLARARQRARRHRVTAVEVQTGWGNPAQAIIDTVRVKKPDILVVGRRGRVPGQVSIGKQCQGGCSFHRRRRAPEPCLD